ncbi:hypothetical protein OEZ85_000084 [Tetradesmus obliquus]|uniref:Apple domain-containing protein n=1 Tax=Tetradesmus obliquus TaxID=3088 RepID=A0ABY8UP26_TETOB|nr:hypothetical protein OEZ85_000084 [Tetradesmus obliquus]
MSECDKVDPTTGSNCQFFTYDYANGACDLRVAAGTPTGLKKIAYKVLAGNGLGLENRKRSLLGGAKPKEMGSGVFSWFNDDYGREVGVEYTPASSCSTLVCALQTCNDAQNCTAVVMELPSSSTTMTYYYRQGIVTVPLVEDSTALKRTMVRYRYDVPAGVKPPNI